MGITRKAFLVDLASGLGLVTLAGCGGGGSSSDGGVSTPVGASAGSCGADIGANHGHVLLLPRADLDSTTDKTYNIQGDADHNHRVTFTAADLANLKAGRAVSVQTTVTLGHQHGITEDCM